MEIINKILDEAKKIADEKSFDVCKREFEIKITEVAKNIKLDKELYDELINLVNTNYKDNKKLSFVLFFILFTASRRQNYSNCLTFCEEYYYKYEEYEIIKHIRLMAVLEKCTNIKRLYSEINLATKLIDNNECFKNHQGFLNVYTALICKYFEYHLDERLEDENVVLLAKGLKAINLAIQISKEEIGKVYSKFYLNRGRILILLKKYDKGEADIVHAIEEISDSSDRYILVNDYNQYLVKASIIRAYDLNEERVNELDKVKVSNYKSIALMTTLLGFLLGTINIFASVNDTKTLALLMLCYLGLLFVLIGTILLGFSLTFKDKKKYIFIYDSLLILLGVIIFAITMFIINK